MDVAPSMRHARQCTGSGFECRNWLRRTLAARTVTSTTRAGGDLNTQASGYTESGLAKDSTFGSCGNAPRGIHIVAQLVLYSHTWPAPHGSRGKYALGYGAGFPCWLAVRPWRRSPSGLSRGLYVCIATGQATRAGQVPLMFRGSSTCGSCTCGGGPRLGGVQTRSVLILGTSGNGC